jgi:hypothetical protein
LNLILLGVFTGLEAITIGSVVSYFDSVIVLQALVITTFVFIGLTLFTFQVSIQPPPSLSPTDSYCRVAMTSAQWGATSLLHSSSSSCVQHLLTRESQN